MSALEFSVPVGFHTIGLNLPSLHWKNFWNHQTLVRTDTQLSTGRSHESYGLTDLGYDHWSDSKMSLGSGPIKGIPKAGLA